MSNIVKHEGGGTSIAREGLGSRELERRNETASSAVVAQARAEIEAAFVVARANPRDDDNVRAALLKNCKKKNFAERAYYSIERRGADPGRLTDTPGRIEGLSVRFAEAAIRLMGNVRQQTRTLYDDDVKRIVQVGCIDLETNAAYSRDVTVEKTIERRTPREGQVVLGKRENSTGDTVYIIQASDEEILQKESALVSRTFRTLALRLVPADTLQECEREIIATVRSEISRDPDGARKAILDSFLNLNVKPSDLKLYLGHDVDQSTPAELEHLRGLYGAIRDGEVTWVEALAEKTAPATEEKPKDGKAAKKSAGATVAERVKERLEKQARAKAKDATPAAKPADAPATSPAAAEPKPAASADADSEPPPNVKTVGSDEPGQKGQ